MSDTASDGSSIGASPEEEGADAPQPPSPASPEKTEPLRNAIAALGAMLGREQADRDEEES